MSERIVPRLTDQIQGVGETIVQVALDRHGLVERSDSILRNLFGKLRNARIKRRKLQICCGDIRRIVRQSRAQLDGIEGRQAGNTGIPYGTVIVERIQKRTGGIPKDRSAAHRGKRVSAFTGKISAKTSDSPGDENGIGGKRFEVYGVEHARIMRIGLGCRIRGNPPILFGLQFFRLVIRRSPPPPVKGRERNAPPAQPVVTDWLTRLHAHYYCGIPFDFADLTELDVFGEAGHKRRAEAGAAEISGAETRKKEKQHATKDDGSDRHAQSRKTQRAIQSSIALGVQMESRRDGADGSAA